MVFFIAFSFDVWYNTYMRRYYNYQVEKLVQVKNLVTIEYHDFPKGYQYPMEEHHFYEFVYVEKGSLSCLTKDYKYDLLQGDFLLITPNTPHEYEVQEKVGARALVVCFNSNSTVLQALSHKISANDSYNLISALLDEARRCFEFPFKKKLVPLKTPDFASQQMVTNYIEQLLIFLLRSELSKKNKIEIKFVKNKRELERAICDDIVAYLSSRLFDDVSLSDVSEKIYYSKTYLNNVFKKVKGYSIMQYYNLLKIEEAKKLLPTHPVVYVSDALCFSDPNYFTKVFQKFAGTTPSKYKKG